MKSIMEEASSIIKAIEKGWIQAGKPQEFSIKIFEEPTKNFLGLTTKPAKIGIFFTEKNTPSSKTFKPREDFPKNQPSKKSFPQPQQMSSHQYQTKPAKASKPIVEGHLEKRTRETWTPEMVEATKSWVRETLSLMAKSNQDFTIDTKNYYLKINFPTPLFDDLEKERLLFRSLAHLIMQSLRNKFKKSFRGFKIILSSPQ